MFFKSFAFVSCFFFLTLPAALHAQQWMGLANSNYAGTHGVHANPSSIADTRFGYYINLGAAQAGLTNNYYRLESPYALPRLALGKFEGQYELKPEYYREINTARPRLFDLRAEARLPSLLVRLSARHSVAFTNRMRGSFEADNLTPFIANDFRINNLTLVSLLSNGSRLRLNSNVVRETGLTYARQLWAAGPHYLKGGLTLKYLQGVYSSSLYSDNLQTELAFANGEPVLRVLAADIGYHYTQARDYPDEELFDAMLWKSRNGRGVGADIGFTYEYRPDVVRYAYQMDGRTELDNLQNKYRWRVGLSMLDAGSLRYHTDYADTTASAAYAIRRTNTDLPQQQLQDASLDNYYPVLNRGLAVGAADRQASFRARMPAMLHLNMDYRLADKFYLNAAWMPSLRRREALGMRHRSLVAFTPRYETKHFEFSLPMMLVNGYRQATFGAMLRLGSFFFIGTDNLPGVLNLGRPFGMDIYTGITISGLRGRKRDRDNDGVSDKEDACPVIAGVWAFKGCPDTDEDGVEDRADKCPTEPGLKDLGGCPDADGDKITDAFDKCPQQAGPARLNGCPDTDEDGVLDRDDDCPAAKGVASLNGCPDRDGDSVPDKNDRCPDERGQARYNGCADNDGDNLPNPDDACPDQAGTIRFNGCPDRDGDAVPDKDDRCPDAYGPALNAGCPGQAASSAPDRTAVQLPVQEQQVLDEAFDDLEFETGKAVIKVASYESLDDLAGLLAANTAYRLLLSGHTDNVGKAATNLKISKARADAVKKYLVRKGVAPDQLITEGFGPRKPVADNRTAEGRQRNRRVEMKVIR